MDKYSAAELLPEEKLQDIEQYLEPWQYQDDNERFSPVKCAANIVFDMLDEEKLTGINRGILVTKDAPIIYRFNGGYYEPDGERFLRSKVQKLAGYKASTGQKDAVVDWVRDCQEIQVDRDIFDRYPEKIMLNNCTYDIITNTIEEKDSRYFKTNAFPINYDPDAECPKFQQFLSEVIYKKDITVIQEMMGYCYWKPYDFQKAFMLLGEGANGKGVLLHILTNMLGERNIATFPLQQVMKRFNTYSLYGKYANICGDLSAREIYNEGLFKQLTGGDMISAEIKHIQGHVKFRNTAKLINASNVIPTCKDDTYAYKRRWIVIKFPNRFSPEDPNTNPNLKYELETEIQGIFNWCMEGLRRLLDKKRFSAHKTLDDALEYQETYKDDVFQFCKACITQGHETYSRKDLYKRYTNYCDMIGLQTVRQAQFTQKMQQYGPKTLSLGQTRQHGKCFHGIIYTPATESSSPTAKKDNVGGLEVEYDQIDYGADGGNENE